MPKQSESADSNDTPKADKAKPDLPETVRSPEYVNTPVKGKPVVVLNTGANVYATSHLEHSKEKGANGRAKYIPHQFIARPGLSVHDSGLIETLTKNSPRFARQVEAGQLEVLGNPANFYKLRARKCLEAVEATIDLDLLEALLEGEKREDVAGELEDRIAELKKQAEQSEDVRRKQRRANRRRRRH